MPTGARGVEGRDGEEPLGSGANHDARVLATMVVDPARARARELAAWAAALDNHVVSDALAGFVQRTPLDTPSRSLVMESRK